MDRPHILADSPMNPPERPDNIRRIGSSAHPAQMAEAGEHHHRADGYVIASSELKKGRDKLTRVCILNENDCEAVTDFPSPPSRQRRREALISEDKALWLKSSGISTNH